MLPLMRRPSLKELLRETREAALSEMQLSHQRVMRDGGVLRIQPLQVHGDSPGKLMTRWGGWLKRRVSAVSGLDSIE